MTIGEKPKNGQLFSYERGGLTSSGSDVAEPVDSFADCSNCDIEVPVDAKGFCMTCYQELALQKPHEDRDDGKAAR